MGEARKPSEQSQEEHSDEDIDMGRTRTATQMDRDFHVVACCYDEDAELLIWPCPGGCGFQVTWHASHCRGRCAQNNGHVERCERKAMPKADATSSTGLNMAKDASAWP